jgi:DNA-binding NtrC family response regulator
MPIMDGIALSLMVGKEYPKMKIIIMSGHEHQIERAHGLSDLVYRVVSKPFTIAGICAVVDDVLGAKK